MPTLTPNIDQSQQDQLRLLDAQYGQAQHDATWGNMFTSTPPAEVLRRNVNATQLGKDALEMKARLLAQQDENAAKIYETNAQMAEWQRQAPLRDELLRRKTEAEGATERFHQYQDAETLSHVSGFMDAMTRAPQMGTPEYHTYALKSLQQFPRVATSQIGKDAIKNIADSHDLISHLFETPADVQAVDPKAKYRQDPKTGRYYISSAGGSGVDKETRKNFYDEVSGLGLKPYAFENDNAWQSHPGTDKKSYQDANTKQLITIDGEHYNRLKSQYEALHGGGAESAAPVQDNPDVSQQDYDNLKSGETFHWRGKTLTKK